MVSLVLLALSGQALPAPSTSSSPAVSAIGPLLAGAGGAAAGALVAWALSKPLVSAFHRAALAMMAVMGTALVAAATLPAHQLAGRTGLAALVVLCLVVIVIARRTFLGTAA